jgi:hypothetical protein
LKLAEPWISRAPRDTRRIISEAIRKAEAASPHGAAVEQESEL